MRITAKDVAERAGVAASTVSRALNSPGRINEQTRKRILDAARELGYSVAPRMIERKGLVGLLVPDITNPFYFDIIRSTQEQLRIAGFMQLLIDTGESGRTEAEILAQLSQVVDGVILSATRLDAAALATAADALPLAVINRQQEEIPGVLIDIRTGLTQAVDHLKALGHRTIAFIAGPPGSWQNRWRWKEFEEQVLGQGLTPVLVGPYAPTRTGGAAAADALLVTEATACVAFNDLLAIGILQRLRQRGIRVPEDMSVVGCDDIFGADFSAPPLTTIAGDTKQAGRLAASRLIATLNGEAPRNGTTLIPTHLLVRESTGPVRTHPSLR
ncbi:LacI family DNA-binding transcriptional regulator [Microbacterium sp. ABRD28]|uniref:LacI family DNA-binding transcriptional regulator n=1 Tax=Microbacterium sp. ABRD28 TaxID=2268461 RepID=UPI000F552D94|nr:LacI family DNA-binding transcriptional regulator [Microbacterium sp. ABRD28]AZC13238.1 LacI family transcriptional regulator [Microbacterium sp. ABRD28]